MASRYCIGIDLGTSNCSLSWIDTLDLTAGVRTLNICQWDSEHSYFSAHMLPSFIYLPPKNLRRQEAFKLPWPVEESEQSTTVPGLLARNMLSTVPERVIHSAKSWLCHQSADGESPFLPWLSELTDAHEKISPVEATACLLKHLRQAWDAGPGQAGASESFIRQHITLTVPASFSEAASRLTRKAAELAGYPSDRLYLLEEPQAACYDWQYSSHLTQEQHTKLQTWKDFVSISQKKMEKLLEESGQKTFVILVCDIGGGTTDFSLIELKEKDGEIFTERKFVSDHLLLGGDNLDLRIASLLESHMEGSELARRSRLALRHEARKIKEKVLSSLSCEPSDELHVAIAKEGSSLFGLGQSVSIRQDEVRSCILDGFFPDCTNDPAAADSGDIPGLRDWGLPYARDCRISAHLAWFLRGQAVDAVLFAGGTMKPPLLQTRILTLLESWQKRAPVQLKSPDMDLAVSRGAALAGAARMLGEGRIRGGYPRSLYLEIARPEEESTLACILPRGLDTESPYQVPGLRFKAQLGKAVSFRMYQSLREHDTPGTLIHDWKHRPDIHPVASLSTRLEAKEKGATHVTLEVSPGKTGLLTLSCLQDQKPTSENKKNPDRWDLTFDVRACQEHNPQPSATDAQRELIWGASDQEQKVQECFSRIYGKSRKKAAPQETPSEFIRTVETYLGIPKKSWGLVQLRALWEIIRSGESRRSRSEQHEAVWLNLAGYTLRPGYGADADPLRMEELWDCFHKGPAHASSPRVRTQWWIMWRRVAGGLNRQHQEQILQKILPAIRKDDASPEIYLLAGALERIAPSLRLRLGQLLTDALISGRLACGEQKMLALSRIVSRVPLYAGPEAIISPEQVVIWGQTLDKLAPGSPPGKVAKFFYSRGGRIIGNQDLDLDETGRQYFLRKLKQLRAGEELSKVVCSYLPISHEEQQSLFGEELPPGLTLS